MSFVRSSDTVMSTSSSWRDLLKEVISDVGERERIAKAVGVSPVTLSRWASGESLSPRSHNVHHLVQAFPAEQRAAFVELVGQEPGTLREHDSMYIAHQIDYPFIQQLWETRASTPAPLQFWALSGKILQNALRQLALPGVGLAITIAQLMPPSAGGVIRSLREVAGLGTPPWPPNLEHHMQFLGAESLAGYAASYCRSSFIDDLRDQVTFLPVYQTEHEVSAVACPIMYANRVAGCLLFSSTQPGYFQAEARRTLINDYAHLLAPTFHPVHFFSPEQIALQMMPPLEVQQTMFVTFQRRVNVLMTETYQASRALPRLQAEEFVWQQIEDELLHSASVPGKSSSVRHE
jgi:transcriptional regulator with XRE-family HTH domain